MVNFTIETNKLYELLIGKNTGEFEAYRSQLIKLHGYANFRMILKQAYYKLNAVDYTLKAL